MRAREILAERLRRARLFPHLGEPAWLMLLDLYISEEVDTSVTSACLASFVPQTTALRYIGELEAEGLIEREADPADRRRVLLRLADEARERLAGFFGQLPHAKDDTAADLPKALSPAAPVPNNLHAAPDSRAKEHDHVR